MAETVVDSGIEIDSGAMFRNIMDAPKGGQPEPSQQPAQPDGGEPAAPAQRQDAPQLTEHQRQQVQPEAEQRPPGERQRDPTTGRFIPQAGDPQQGQPGGQPTGADGGPGAHGAGEDGSPVPSWRLREERETREAYATQLRESQETNRQLMAALQRLQQPVQAPQPAPQRELPDPVLDPQGYHAAVMGEVTQAIRATQLDTDLRMAHARHGDKFEKAYEAFLAVAPQHPDFARSVVNGPTPGERMVEWYERQTMMQEIGPDPQAWMARQLTAALANPEFLQKAIDAATAQARNGGAPAARSVGGGPGVRFQLPPTLSRLPSGSPDGDQQLNAGRSEQDSEHMFRNAMDSKRPRR